MLLTVCWWFLWWIVRLFPLREQWRCCLFILVRIRWVFTVHFELRKGIVFWQFQNFIAAGVLFWTLSNGYKRWSGGWRWDGIDWVNFDEWQAIFNLLVKSLSACHFDQIPFFIQNMWHERVFVEASNMVWIFRFTALGNRHKRWCNQNGLEVNEQNFNHLYFVWENATHLVLFKWPTISSNCDLNKCRMFVSNVNAVNFGWWLEFKDDISWIQTSLFALPFFVQTTDEIRRRVILIVQRNTKKNQIRFLC